MSDKRIEVCTVQGRYAQAFFEVALEEKMVDKVSKELNEVKLMLQESDDFVTMVKSPLFRAKEQIDTIQQLSKKLNFSALTSHLLSLLAKNRRLTILEQVITHFFAISDRASGRFNVYVTTAKKLDKKQFSSLTHILKEKLGDGVNLVEHVDKSIIGGLVLTYKSHMIDSSIANRLKNLKRRMKEVV